MDGTVEYASYDYNNPCFLDKGKDCKVEYYKRYDTVVKTVFYAYIKDTWYDYQPDLDRISIPYTMRSVSSKTVEGKEIIRTMQKRFPDSIEDVRNERVEGWRGRWKEGVDPVLWRKYQMRKQKKAYSKDRLSDLSGFVVGSLGLLVTIALLWLVFSVDTTTPEEARHNRQVQQRVSRREAQDRVHQECPGSQVMYNGHCALVVDHIADWWDSNVPDVNVNAESHGNVHNGGASVEVTWDNLFGEEDK